MASEHDNPEHEGDDEELLAPGAGLTYSVTLWLTQKLKLSKTASMVLVVLFVLAMASISAWGLMSLLVE